MKDCGITASIHKMRFRDGCRKLKGNIASNNQSDNDQNRIQPVIMTKEESESMELLTAKLTTINVIKDINASQMNQAEQTRQNHKQEIKSIFDTLRDALNEREESLMKQIDDLTDDTILKLQKQQSGLLMYEQLIMDAQNEQNSILLDLNSNRLNRQHKIQSITTTTLDSIDNSAINAPTENIVLTLSTEADKEFISRIGQITIDKEEHEILDLLQSASTHQSSVTPSIVPIKEQSPLPLGKCT